MKKAAALITSLIIAGSLSLTAFAGQWQEDENGRWYQNDDGSWPAGTWQWIDSDGDGAAECYYFYSDGYMAHNNDIDGYYVNNDGQWESDGKVLRKNVGGSDSASQASGKTYADVYRQYVAQYGETTFQSKKEYFPNDRTEHLKGINFLALYDLDGNGTEELLIGFPLPTPEYYFGDKYGLDIYTDNGSGAVLCGRIEEAEMWTGGEQSCGIRFMSKDGKTYIVTGSEGTGAGSIYNFYALNNGSVVLENQYDFDEGETFVNGQKSNIPYETLWSGWSQIAHYDFHGWVNSDYPNPEYTMDQTRALIRNTRNKLNV